jgi:hypothetical protein
MKLVVGELRWFYQVKALAGGEKRRQVQELRSWVLLPVPVRCCWDCLPGIAGRQLEIVAQGVEKTGVLSAGRAVARVRMRVQLYVKTTTRRAGV